MDPQQSPTPNYDFIMNPPAKTKKSWLPSGNNPKQRLLMLIAGVGILLIMFIVVISTLFGGKDNTAALIDLAQRQTEIIRVAEIGSDKAEGSAARNLAITTKLTLQTSENETLDRLKKLGVKPKDKELRLKKNSKTDQMLQTAALNNRFDEEFKELIKVALKDYQATVKQLYDSTSNQTEKQLLASSYKSASLLIQ